jgi:hypothetical protein
MQYLSDILLSELFNRIYKNVTVFNSGCWVWQTRFHQPRIRFQRKQINPKLILYSYLHSTPIPVTLESICGNQSCINPHHHINPTFQPNPKLIHLSADRLHLSTLHTQLHQNPNLIPLLLSEDPTELLNILTPLEVVEPSYIQPPEKLMPKQKRNFTPAKDFGIPLTIQQWNPKFTNVDLIPVSCMEYDQEYASDAQDTLKDLIDLIERGKHEWPEEELPARMTWEYFLQAMNAFLSLLYPTEEGYRPVLTTPQYWYEHLQVIKAQAEKNPLEVPYGYESLGFNELIPFWKNTSDFPNS